MTKAVPKKEATPGRKQQLSKAREAAVYSRELKTMARLERELAEINEWVVAYKSERGETVDTAEQNVVTVNECVVDQVSKQKAQEAEERAHDAERRAEEAERMVQEAQQDAARAIRAADRGRAAAEEREKEALMLMQTRMQEVEAQSQQACPPCESGSHAEGTVELPKERLEAFCTKQKGFRQVRAFCEGAGKAHESAYRGSNIKEEDTDSTSSSSAHTSSTVFDSTRAFDRAQLLAQSKLAREVAELLQAAKHSL